MKEQDEKTKSTAKQQVDETNTKSKPDCAEKNENDTQKQATTNIIFFGSCKWDLLGRKTIPKSVLKNGGSDAGEELLGPTRLIFQGYPDTKFVSIHSGCAASHLIFIDEEGQAYGLGRNDCGQIGQPDFKSHHHLVEIPIPLHEDERVVTATCGRNHTLFVTSNGRGFACGNNHVGQLGCGNTSDNHTPGVPNVVSVQIDSSEKIVACSAGGEFSVWACESGRLFAAGNGQYGQLGNSRTGEHINSSGRIQYDIVSKPVRVVGFGSDDDEVEVTQIASGINHTLALDVNGKVWSWGWGGYGRLGHRTPKDELVPKQIELFNADHYKLDFVACGQTSSFAVQRNRKSCFSWGITKKTGESNMYPKPLFDLQGWVVRTLACGATSTVLCAEQSVISWGGSPTFGELGYGIGKQKSSTKPQQIKSLEGLEIEQLCEGQAFTAMLITAKTEEEHKVIDGLDKLEIVNDMKTENGKRKTPEVTNGKKKAKGKAKKQKR